MVWLTFCNALQRRSPKPTTTPQKAIIINENIIEHCYFGGAKLIFKVQLTKSSEFE